MSIISVLLVICKNTQRFNNCAFAFRNKQLFGQTIKVTCIQIKIIFHICACEKVKNDPDNICESFPTLLVLGGSLVLGIATHASHLPWSHRAGLDLQMHLLMAVLSESFSLVCICEVLCVGNSNDHQKDVLMKVI